MASHSRCRSCSEVHEENPCTCGHPYHGHGHGLDFVISGGRCLNCRCSKYNLDGEVPWTDAPVPVRLRSDAPVLTDEEKAAGFAEVMRRLRSRTPEERVLMAADTELSFAESRILGEDLVADLEAINARLKDRRRAEAAEGVERDERPPEGA